MPTLRRSGGFEKWNKKIRAVVGGFRMKMMIREFKKEYSWLSDRFIQEGNWWGDTFWGVDLKSNTGENNLGLLIMAICDELVIEESSKKLPQIMVEKGIGFVRRLLRLG